MRYLKLSKINNKKQYIYEIADSEYCSNKKIDAFSCWGISNSNIAVKISTAIQKYSASSNLYHDHASIGENVYNLCVDAIKPTGYILKTKNQNFQINQNSIQCSYDCIDDTLLFGPVLILNLAMNGVFCLHASAFLLKGKVFILMGNSGTGKSSIARFMNEQDHAIRLTDDILPLKIINDEITVLPNFPQLKLSADKQYKGDAIMGEVVLLFAEKSIGETQLTPIDVFGATKSLVNHSVATKLFAKNELQNHLTFCHQVSTKVKSFCLNYQHHTESLDQLYNLLNEID